MTTLHLPRTKHNHGLNTKILLANDSGKYLNEKESVILENTPHYRYPEYIADTTFKVVKKTTTINLESGITEYNIFLKPATRGKKEEKDFLFDSMIQYPNKRVEVMDMDVAHYRINGQDLFIQSNYMGGGHSIIELIQAFCSKPIEKPKLPTL